MVIVLGLYAEYSASGTSKRVCILVAEQNYQATRQPKMAKYSFVKLRF